LREILRQKEARKHRNTLCISSLSNEFLAQKIRKAPQTYLIRGSLIIPVWKDDGFVVERDSHIKLALHTGEEHNLYINSNIDDPSDLMYPAFQSALVSLKEILRNAGNWLCEEPGRREQQDRLTPSRSRQLYEYSNNILAFCAERGQGKTSAMLSFAEALRAHSRTDKILRSLEEMYFYVIPPIDPTLLEKEDSVVEIVLSRLYHEFNHRLEQGYSGGRTLSAADKGELLGYFQDCMCGLRTANQRNVIDDDFEALTQLSDCFEVKSLCEKILKRFFHFIGKNPRNSYLVIPLDDTDLQFQYAYKTLEEVRKYLSLPNIVILMATDLEQLRKLIIDHHLSMLEHAVSNNVIVPSEIQRMASKYLDKLIPASHTIYLPTVRVQCESNKEILLASDGGAGVELQKGVLDLVYQKTGIIFVRTGSGMHPLIPTTLRGLRQFYRFLTQMEACGAPDLPASKPSTEEENFERRKNFCGQMLTWASKHEVNLNLFENYFVNDWCSSKLSNADWKLLRQFQLLSPKGCFSQAEKQLKKALSTGSRDGRRGRSSAAQDDKAGIVQLLEQLNDAEQLDIQYFPCAIQTYLSIQLHRLALKGWRDSLYQWMDGGPNQSFVFHFPELYECIGGSLVYTGGKAASASFNGEFWEQVKQEPGKALAAPWLERLSADLVNCLPKMLTASQPGLQWQDEAMMVQRLKFVLEICCNLSLHAEVCNYIQRSPISISPDESYKNNNSIINFYNKLSAFLAEKAPLSGSLYGFSPISSQPEVFQTETLHQLEEYLGVVQAGRVKSALNSLCISLRSHTADLEVERLLSEAIKAVADLAEYKIFEANSNRWNIFLMDAQQKYLGNTEQTIEQGNEPKDKQKGKQSDKAETIKYRLTEEILKSAEAVLAELDEILSRNLADKQNQQGGGGSGAGI